MKYRRSFLAGVLGTVVFGIAGAASAGPRVTSGSAPVVEVRTGNVSVEVQGWAKKRIEVVTSDLPAGWSVRLEEKNGAVHVRFDGVGVPGRGRVKLRAPKGADLRVTTRTGDIVATDQEGNVRATTITGHVNIQGATQHVEVNSTSGRVDLRGTAGECELRTVSGDIQVEAAKGTIRAKTVSGGVVITKSALARLVVGSVNGAINYDGTLGDGRHRLNSHSGAVSVALPKAAAVSLGARSFSGTIEDKMVEPAVTAKRRYARKRGENGPEVEVSSFSGSIVFLAR